MGNKILIEGGTLVTVDEGDRVIEADLLIRGDRIERIIRRTQPDPQADQIQHAAVPDAGESQDSDQPSDYSHDNGEVIDASGCAVLPGFVQTHVHLCQTLMRGYADDLGLIQWLRDRVWPMEAAHTPESLYASARLGIAEMISGGTTAALTMETVRHTEAVFRAVKELGFRATVGKCMMDRGEGVPAELVEQTRSSVEDSLALLDEWSGRGNGRIRYAFAPRFALSCSRSLLEQVAELARERGAMIQTHASESREETELVCAETGLDNITYLHLLGLTGPHTVLAHCVWATDEEIALLADTGTGVSHCPSSNLKLGSGIARITEMMDRGVEVSVGADGAPCNNRLDMLTEIRTAALLQKVRRGPQTLSARAALRLATIEGARAIGLESEIGSIEEGKRADLAVIDLSGLHLAPHPDIVSAIIFAAERADVRTVIVDGKVLMRDRELLTLDKEEVKAAALSESLRLAARAAVTF